MSHVLLIYNWFKCRNASWRRDLNWGSVLAPLSTQTTSWPGIGGSCLKPSRLSRLLNTSTLPLLTWPTFHWRRIDIFWVHFLGHQEVWVANVVHQGITNLLLMQNLIESNIDSAWTWGVGRHFKDCGGFGCLEGCWCWHESKHLYCYIAWKSCIPTYHGE